MQDPQQNNGQPHWSFTAIAYGLGFSGFNLLLLFLASFGLRFDSRIYTIPYRIVFLVFAMAFIGIILKKGVMAKLGWLWFPLMTYWILYFLRIYLDGYLLQVNLRIDAFVYVQRAIGAAFIPMLIFLKPLTKSENTKVFLAFWTIHLACLLMAFVLYRDLIESSYRLAFGGHQNVDAAILLGPIGISYIGVLAIVISIQRACLETRHVSKWLFTLAYLGIVLAGMLILLLGETRSAVISCVVATIIVLLTSLNSTRTSTKLKIVALAILAGTIMFFSIERYGGGTTRRFQFLLEQIERSDMAIGGGRRILYQNAIDQFLQSPLLGSGLEEKISGTYPHNHIIEAFMATGILGGLAFIILSSIALYYTYMILKYDKERGWVGIIFIVYLLRGMFSASIIDAHLWYSMMAVIALWLSRKEAQSTDSELEKRRTGISSQKQNLPKYYH